MTRHWKRQTLRLTQFWWILKETAKEKWHTSNHWQRKKYHRGDSRDGNSQEGRMYVTPSFPLCLVSSFERYVENLNTKVDYFWQQTNYHFVCEMNVTWYYKIPIGKNMLDDKMKILSLAADLLTVYTNHSLRERPVLQLWTSRIRSETHYVCVRSEVWSEHTILQPSRIWRKDKREMILALSSRMTRFMQ